MSFMETTFMGNILKRNIPIWDKCIAAPFVRAVQDGTLPFESFREYMIQDSIYLKNYARLYGRAIYHARSLQDIRLYYSALGFVTEQESAVRLSYLEQFGLSDDDIECIAPLPENQAYIDFMFTVAERDDPHEMLMALLPCMLSYSYIFRRIAAAPESRTSRYRDFIQDYADEEYAQSCREWCLFAEKKCGSLAISEQHRLGGIFEKASLLELGFWNMSYGRDRL